MVSPLRNSLAKLSIVAGLTVSSLACIPPVGATTSTASTAPTDSPGSGGMLLPQLGSDVPADFETTGYFSNHFSLIAKNLTGMVDFYTTVFGFRRFLTVPVTDRVSFTYMGHAHGGHNGTGYQTAAELAREKNNSGGLMELVHVNVTDNDIPASSDETNTFSHIGIVVPDIEATQERLDKYSGFEMLKRLNDPVPRTGRLANALNLGENVVKQLGEKEFAQVVGVFDVINKPFIFVADPDGNVLEIQPQEEMFSQ